MSTKVSDSTGGFDSIVGLRHSVAENTETGEKADGYGFNREEADRNAYKHLKEEESKED
jgi:hypothetical protein